MQESESGRTGVPILRETEPSAVTPIGGQCVEWRASRWSVCVLCCLLAVHTALLGWCAYRDSFAWDEIAHLPSGLHHWESGRFAMYRVNPPLVRLIAALPLLIVGYEADWSGYNEDVTLRPEWPISERFLQLNGERSFWLLTLARWACLPFSLLGLWVCWRWAGELYGGSAAMLAGTMWCFSPNILGHGHLITPDVAGAALGIAAFYNFWHWLRDPRWSQALMTGIVFGQAQSAKASWIVLFAMWPMMWLAWRESERQRTNCREWLRQAAQMLVVLLIGVWSINAWYGFEGSFQPLGEYRFLSKSLGGRFEEVAESGNRFEGTWLASLSVPLPRQYVQGIDRQKHHFERPDWSYLRGEWRDKGWWHYYVYAALVKEPVGYWLLGLLAVGLGIGFARYRTAWRVELLLLIALAALTLFISSQRGFNRHLRYLLPAFPFAFVLVSRVARSVDLKEWRFAIPVAVALVWSVTSSLLVYPHPMGYFNELAGGPMNGHAHLLSSNTDWGQDLLYLKRWYEAHPEARPMSLKWHTRTIDPALAGLPQREVPTVPTPGWHALSVNDLRSRDGKHADFLKTKPVATAGYSIFIYHLTEEDCRRIDAVSGLSHLEPVWQVQAHAGEVRFCALSPNEEWLVTAGGDRAIKLWNVARREAETFDGGPDTATAAAFTRDGRELLIGHGSGHVSRWNIETREKLSSDPGHSGAISQLAVSPDGQWFATSGRDRSVRLWSLAERTSKWSQSTALPALSVAFSPNGQWLAVGMGERQQVVSGAIRIHSVETGDIVAVLTEASDLAKSVAFSPDSAWLASRGSGGDLRLWDTRTWKSVRRFPDSLQANRWLFVPPGDRLSSVDFNGIVKLWEAGLDALPLRFRAHSGPVNDVAVTADGEWLFTVARDGFLKQWSLND